VRDMDLGTNHLVSVSYTNSFADNTSIRPFFSPDGRWVLFSSLARNLISSTDPWRFHGDGALFARDLTGGQTLHVSDLKDIVGQAQAQDAAFSPDSRWVVFVAGLYGTASREGIYLRDLGQPTNAVAVVTTGDPMVRLSTPRLSARAQQMVYARRSYADYRPQQVLLWDRQAGASIVVSSNQWTGTAGNGASTSQQITPDGQFVIYASTAGNLVENDTNACSDIFVRDRLRNISVLVNINPQGRAGNGASSLPVLAADGRTVVFRSFASDLAEGDYNGQPDLFVLRLSAGDRDGDSMDDDWEMAFFSDLSRDGSEDFDDDGLTDRQEFLAGTDPTNQGSVLRALVLTPSAGGPSSILWPVVPGRVYRVEFKDTLAAGPWTTLPGQLTVMAGTGSLVDSTSTAASQRYYRVSLQP
jgi:Tol biopolymer transport system component